PSTWSTRLTLPAPASSSAPQSPERAGLVVLGHAYAWAGLLRDADGVALASGTMAADAAAEEVQVHRLLTAAPAAEVTLGLQLDTTAGGRVTLTALLDGERLPLLVDWQAEKGHWIGAEVGLFDSPRHGAPSTRGPPGSLRAGGRSSRRTGDLEARGRGGPTITQVAEAAGVSRATVSRVLNQHPSVDPGIGARVREAAQRLQYRPNATARNLSTGRTRTIALIIPDMGNPMFQSLLRGIS